MRFNVKTTGVAVGFALLPKLIAALDRIAEPRTESSGESLEMIQATNDAIATAIATIDELRAANASIVAEYNRLVKEYKKLQTKTSKAATLHGETEQMAVFVADCSEAYRVEAERLTKENARLLAENRQYELCCEKLNDRVFDLKHELGYEDF